MKLEDKLNVVKERLYERLKQGEMEYIDYSDFVENGLREQGLIEPDDSSLINKLTSKVLNKFEQKLSIESFTGLLGSYQKIKGVELSDKAKEDVETYNNLLVSTKNYLTEQIGSEEVPRTEFMDMVEDYVMDNTELPEDMSGIIKCLISNRVSGAMERYFNVVKDPEMIGNCRVDKLDEALDKI